MALFSQVFLPRWQMSPKTLERMRLDGSGPTCILGGSRGARGGNQKCLYLKADLLTWQQANQVSNAMETAVRRNHVFGTIFDLITDAPFYLNSSGMVAGAAEEVSLHVAIERLGVDAWDLIWLPVVEAVGGSGPTCQPIRSFQCLFWLCLSRRGRKSLPP